MHHSQLADNADMAIEREREPIADIVASAFPHALPVSRRMLISKADIRDFPARQTIVAQDDDSRIVLVIEGHAGVRRTTPEGREVIVRIASQGQLAPMMAIAGRPTAVEAVALTPTRVAFWFGKELHACAETDAGFAVDLLGHVLLALEELANRMEGLVYQDAQRRVARVLEEHADILFGEEAPLTRAYLPALIGTSREMTGRVIRKLESDGVVARIGRDRLKLLDANRLSRIAGPPPTQRASRAGNKFLAEAPSAMRE